MQGLDVIWDRLMSVRQPAAGEGTRVATSSLPGITPLGDTMRVRHFDLAANVVNILEQELLRARGEAEVCGLLGGSLRETGTTEATVVHPLGNLSLRKTSFAVDVEEFCQARDMIEAAGLMPLALYHSHPNGSTRPSSRDKELPWITGLASLIIAWDGEKLLYECYSDAR